MSATLRVLLLGDLMGKTGRDVFSRHLGKLREHYSPDITIVNGENCAEVRELHPQ